MLHRLAGIFTYLGSLIQQPFPRPSFYLVHMQVPMKRNGGYSWSGNRSASFDLSFSTDKGDTVYVTISDVTVLKFIGDLGKGDQVVISNSLIHQYFGARKRRYKYYVYFSLKENIPFENFIHFFGSLRIIRMKSLANCD